MRAIDKLMDVLLWVVVVAFCFAAGAVLAVGVAVILGCIRWNL